MSFCLQTLAVETFLAVAVTVSQTPALLQCCRAVRRRVVHMTMLHVISCGPCLGSYLKLPCSCMQTRAVGVAAVMQTRTASRAALLQVSAGRVKMLDCRTCLLASTQGHSGSRSPVFSQLCVCSVKVSLHSTNFRLRKQTRQLGWRLTLDKYFRHTSLRAETSVNNCIWHPSPSG
jgi:hypothetical protein